VFGKQQLGCALRRGSFHVGLPFLVNVSVSTMAVKGRRSDGGLGPTRKPILILGAKPAIALVGLRSEPIA
jgi:hypothetical protein